MSHWKWGMSILQSIRIKSYHSVEKLKCKFLSFIVYNSVPQNGVSFRPFSLWTFLIFWKIIFFRTGELIICEIYAHFTCMFTRYLLRHLYNFISTSSFCFVATPLKIIRNIFFLMFYFIVSKAEFFFTKVVSPSDWTTLTSGEGLYYHKEIVSGPKQKFLFMLENFKVINAGFSFFINNIFSITQTFLLVNRCFFNSNIANLHRLCQCFWF